MSIHEHVYALQESFSELEDDLEPQVYQALGPTINALTEASKASEIYMQNMETIFRVMALMKKHPKMVLMNAILPTWEGLPEATAAALSIVPNIPEGVQAAHRDEQRERFIQRWMLQDDVQEDAGVVQPTPEDTWVTATAAAPLDPLRRPQPARQEIRAAGPQTNARNPRPNDAFPQPVFNWIAQQAG